MSESPSLRVALLAVPDTTASTLMGLYDLLLSARRDWQMLMNRVEVAAPIEVLIVSRDGAPLRCANGVRVEPHAGFGDDPRPDVVVISDLMVPPWQPLGERYDPEAAWVRERYEAGATVASACSGAVLLARTGLLAGLEATSHWGYCEALQREHPDTRWQPDKALVTAGVGQRLLMAGSGTSWHALALFLIARYVGAEEAMQVARINLLDWSSSSPLAYAAMSRTAQLQDPLIARCQEWAAEHYRSEAPVATMAQMSGLAERTFQRRFVQATGLAPLEYVHTLRLEEAKQMLESTELAVEAIALEVGYQDASFFGRLFRRKLGLTPAQYRKRFGALARKLATAARTA
ncbi:GlxA family transcriptional regulator [Rivibacter subsaxonicus]|uniref:AraC family transcriptional regulator with amidase-like domain n=1 Tax=Rivibacter subsaxonicus TaxID=457575 RepID=A0A4Q7VZN1_9BURK|nr:helix-turn-helix domain-containing protein [Rivibacter subsaxonicus]RZU02382.1 AraC family transcriptional regulator with amidase-like domain [Rivibacter subsaxonicus]